MTLFLFVILPNQRILTYMPALPGSFRELDFSRHLKAAFREFHLQ